MWTNVWLLTQKYQRQECGWPSWPKVGAKDTCEFPRSDVITERKNRPGLFLILSKPGLSVGNPRLKMTIQCWGATAGKRKMHPPGLETTLNVPSKDFWRGHKRDHKLQSWLYTPVRPEGKDHFMTFLMNNVPFLLSASFPPFSSSGFDPLRSQKTTSKIEVEACMYH